MSLLLNHSCDTQARWYHILYSLDTPQTIYPYSGERAAFIYLITLGRVVVVDGSHVHCILYWVMWSNCLNLNNSPPRQQWLKSVYPPKMASPVSTSLASSPPSVQGSSLLPSPPYQRNGSGQVARDMVARWMRKPSTQTQKM